MLDRIIDRCLPVIARRALTTSIRWVDDVAVIRLRGRISRAGGDADLRKVIQTAFGRGDRRILLDLRGVRLVDFSGFRELVAASFAAREVGATISLYFLSEKVLSLFQMVQLRELFDVREDEEVGVAAIVTQAPA